MLRLCAFVGGADWHILSVYHRLYVVLLDARELVQYHLYLFLKMYLVAKYLPNVVSQLGLLKIKLSNFTQLVLQVL